MIRTGSFEHWSGKLDELGALYPFQGCEALLVLLVGALWLSWMIWQLRAERAEYARIAAAVRDSNEFVAALAESEPEPPQARQPRRRES